MLLYGHLDKQPEFTGWSEGLDPWTPVFRDGKLYGRGGADDGYAVFASLTAIRALQEQGIPHARCVVLIEASEESGSPDLAPHIDALGRRLGTPSLVVCLDAECGNYEQLWCTTSLRGNLIGTLRADVLTEGVHSGSASGVVPSSFRVLRELLARIEDAHSGAMLVEEFNTPIPSDRRAQAKPRLQPSSATTVHGKFPLDARHARGLERSVRTAAEQYLAADVERDRCTRACQPFAARAMCMRPYTSLKLSFRLPPTTDPAVAAASRQEDARARTAVRRAGQFTVESAMGGWNAPTFAPWLEQSMQRASQAYFGKDSMYMGTGGSIPFMGMLGERFPGTQFLVTGVLGPNSNAHGPNEFLHIDTARKLTACVAQVLADHAQQASQRRAA